MSRQRRRQVPKGTPKGTHVPVMVPQVLRALDPQPGQALLDCTLGFGGHAEAILRRIGPDGRLIALDRDGGQLERTARRLEEFPAHKTFLHRNFADLAEVVAEHAPGGVDMLLADLGVSSMQVDDPGRGFGYGQPGPLDMRMDPTGPVTAADLLERLSQEEIELALRELSDEPDYERIAAFIVAQRQAMPIRDTEQLARLVLDAKGIAGADRRGRAWEKPGAQHPAARTFQALRILVNDELGALERLLAAAPTALRAGGRLAILSFQSGEDRLVKRALGEGYEAGLYEAVSPKPLTPSSGEEWRNFRSTSARLRWARRSGGASDGGQGGEMARDNASDEG